MRQLLKALSYAATLVSQSTWGALSY